MTILTFVKVSLFLIKRGLSWSAMTELQLLTVVLYLLWNYDVETDSIYYLHCHHFHLKK